MTEAYGAFGPAPKEGQNRVLIRLARHTELFNDPDGTAYADRCWPKNPRALSGRLRRVAPNLRQVGIHISLDHREGHRRDRKIIIKAGAVASASSSSIAGLDIDMRGNDLGAELVRTQNRHADASGPSTDE